MQGSLLVPNGRDTMPNNRKPKVTQRPLPREMNVKKKSPMAIISKNLSITGTKHCGDYTFSCGHAVPVYEVLNVHALNQLIGYAKFINQSYGDVYYRGECKLHSTLKPSIFRNCTITAAVSDRLNSLINKILNDPKMQHQMKIKGTDANAKYTIEAMLQHYGVPTRFIDVVDNHWVSIWMGLYKNKNIKQISKYSHYEKREIPLVDLTQGKEISNEEFFQYILLLAVPGQCTRCNNGIYISDNCIEIDLRQALPSIFLRPHAQHGLVIRKRPHSGDNADNYDMADMVIGILKIRIDRAQDWIGSGHLLTQNNLFPPPAYDHGYDVLLSRPDIFDDNEFGIIKYI